MRKTFQLFFLLACCCITVASTAQTTASVSGKVLSEAGDELPSTTITIRDKGSGVQQTMVSGTGGSFSLSSLIVGHKYDLLFEHVGYEPDSVTNYSISAGENSSLLIRLKMIKSSMSEVVVMGYGTQKRSEIIGSVSKIDGEKVNNRTTPQLSNALTGQAPGVTVIQRSGQPGSGAGAIQIRGVGSFTSGTGAFILIDGMPATDFNQVNPNDVESISVLKDASSAAIYGARAANGVILVTTKSGSRAEKLRISYDGYVGMQKVTALPESVSSWEYATAINEAQPGSYTQEQIEKFRNGSDPDNYPNSDFYSQFFKRSAVQTGHNIAINNNTKNSRYVLSLGYLNQDGIVPENNFQRYNLRLNLVTDISRKLTLTTRIASSYALDKQPAPNAGHDFNNMTEMITQVVRYSPNYVIRMSNGDWGGGITGRGTPVSMLNSESFFRSKGLDLNGNLRLDYTPVKGLKLSAIGGGYITYDNSRRFLATQKIGALLIGPSSLAEVAANSNYKTLQALADYTKKLDRHEISFLGGYSFEEAHIETLNAGRSNFPNNELTTIGLGSANGQTNGGNAEEWALQSLFGRLRYNFASRYLLEGVLRYDGSSRFPATKKYAAYPALAIGWRISEEAFVKDNISWLSDLKLKASVGTLGNQNAFFQNVPSYYPWQTLLSTGQNYNYSFGNTVNTGIARATIVDSTLHWESTRTKDIGIEFGLFQNKLSGSISYFDKYTYDILVSPAGSVSGVLGFGVGLKNSGKLQNRGWEFTLDHRNTIGEWAYNIGVNFSIIKNKVLDVGVGNITQLNGLVGNAGTPLFIGYPMNIYYGYKADGLFVNSQDSANWAVQTAVGSQKRPGDIRYVDISGPEGKPDGKITADYDRVILGSRIPKYTLGMNLGTQYKGIDLSVLLQGITGVTGYLSGYAGWAFNNTATIQRWQYEERWTPQNPDRNAAHPRLEIVPNGGTGNTPTSSFWAIDGSYLRIKNIQLGYSLPRAVTGRLGIEGMRISLAGENIVTFSRYRKGWDPEYISPDPYYPILRNFTAGINVIF